MKYKLKKISGDASFREFYRLKKNNKTSIIVSAKKEKFKNLAVYVVINNILNHNRINAPKLLSNHYKNDMIEISDLGEKSFYDHIISKKNKLNSYKSLIKLLIKIQKIKVKKLYKFEKLKIRGLMAIPRPREKEVDQRQVFKQIRDELIYLQNKGFKLDMLSMGMSSDCLLYTSPSPRDRG